MARVNALLAIETNRDSFAAVFLDAHAFILLNLSLVLVNRLRTNAELDQRLSRAAAANAANCSTYARKRSRNSLSVSRPAASNTLAAPET